MLNDLGIKFAETRISIYRYITPMMSVSACLGCRSQFLQAVNQGVVTPIKKQFLS